MALKYRELIVRICFRLLGIVDKGSKNDNAEHEEEHLNKKFRCISALNAAKISLYVNFCLPQKLWPDN
jgi:hypothetical protein